MAVEHVRMEGLEGVLKTLKELPSEMVSKRGGPVRTSLREASLLLVNQAKANVDWIVATPNKGGYPTKSLGLLRDNIITARDSKMEKGERYYVRIRRGLRYPPERGYNVSVFFVGRMLERGTEHRRPMPWLRPAFDAKKHEVLDLFTKRIRSRLDRLVKRVARKNKVKF